MVNDDADATATDEGFLSAGDWERTCAVSAGLGLLGAAIVLAVVSVLGSGGVTDDDLLFGDVQWPVNLAVLIGGCLTLAFAAASLALPRRRALAWRAAAVLTATGTVLVVIGMLGAFGLFGTLSENAGRLGSGLPRAKAACWLAVAGGALVVLAFRGAAPVRRMVVGAVAVAAVIATAVSVAVVDPWELHPEGLSITVDAGPVAGDLPAAIDPDASVPVGGDLATALADVNGGWIAVGDTVFATSDGILLSEPDRDRVSMYDGDGTRRWTARNSGYGIRVLDGPGLVVLSDYRNSYGVDSRTGALKWTVTPGLWSQEEPTGENFRQVYQLTSISDHGRTLVVLDPETGHEAHRFPVPQECAVGAVTGLPNSVIAKVACGGGRAYYQPFELPAGTARAPVPVDDWGSYSAPDRMVAHLRAHPVLADRYQLEPAADGRAVAGVRDRATGTQVLDLRGRELFSCSPDGDCLVTGDREAFPRVSAIVSLTGAHPDLPLTAEAVDYVWNKDTDPVWLRDQVLWLDGGGRVQVADRATGAVRMTDAFPIPDADENPRQLAAVPGSVLAIGNDRITRFEGVRR